MAREGGEPYEEGKILEGMAEALLNSHRFDAGRIALRQALDIYDTAGRARGGIGPDPHGNHRAGLRRPHFLGRLLLMPSLTLPMPSLTLPDASICPGLKPGIASGKVSVKVRAR